MTLLVILVVLLLLSGAFGFGFGGFNRDRWGYYGWSPFGFIAVVLIILWLTGNLHIPR